MTRSLLFATLLTCTAALPCAADLEVVLPDPKVRSAPAKSAKAAPKKTIRPLPKNAPDRTSALPLQSTGLQQVGVIRRGGVPILPSVGPGLGPEVAPTPQTPSQVPVAGRLGRALTASVNVFRMPDAQSQWLGALKQGQQVAIVSQWQGWWAIVMGDGSQGYVPQSHVELLPFQVKSVAPVTPAGAVPAAPPTTPAAAASPLRTISDEGTARSVIEEAYRYVGTPYVYGGNSEAGIDCSGLVRNCFAAKGMPLPRRASEQARIGQPVPLTELQPGDRLYFSVSHENDHTGIYLGNGYFIHAARSRGKVSVDHLSTPLFGNNLTAARR